MHGLTTPLVKCLVTNQDDQSSLRLIERGSFDLWKYMVATRHHITVTSESLCLWVSADEFERKQAIYSRAGTFEPVERILLLSFDEEFDPRCRYVPSRDLSLVESILVSHVPSQVRDNDNFAIEVEPGYAVTTAPHGPVVALEAVRNVGSHTV